jgi:hypothetical protein
MTQCSKQNLTECCSAPCRQVPISARITENPGTLPKVMMIDVGRAS